jgi:hypothetical protein
VPGVAWARGDSLQMEQGSSIREISPNAELKEEIASERSLRRCSLTAVANGRLNENATWIR